MLSHITPRGISALPGPVVILWPILLLVTELALNLVVFLVQALDFLA